MTKNNPTKKAIRARMAATGENYTTAARNIDKPYLLTGPTGSGKSSALTEHLSNKTFDQALLLFGSDRPGRPVAWDTSKANLAISGPSGAGKTNTMHVLMVQAAMRGYDIVLIDFNKGDAEHHRVIEFARTIGAGVEVLTDDTQWFDWAVRAGIQSQAKPLMVFVDETAAVKPPRLEHLHALSFDADFDIFLVSAGQKNAAFSGDHEIRFHPLGQFDRGLKKFEAEFLTGSKKTIVRALPSIGQPQTVNPGKPHLAQHAEPGIDIVFGTVGTGKTTTAHEMSKRYDRRIIQVLFAAQHVGEFPEEDVFEVPDQADGGPMALRTMLRRDPDVIVFDEVRDAATWEVIRYAALSGHRVIVGVHANSMEQATSRLASMTGDDEGITNAELIRSMTHCQQHATSADDVSYTAERTVTDGVGGFLGFTSRDRKPVFATPSGRSSADETSRVERSRCRSCRDIITPDEDSIAFEGGFAHEDCVMSGE
jgi:thymidylate kinase